MENENSTTNARQRAMAAYLGLELTDIGQIGACEFESDEGDFLVLTENEAVALHNEKLEEALADTRTNNDPTFDPDAWIRERRCTTTRADWIAEYSGEEWGENDPITGEFFNLIQTA